MQYNFEIIAQEVCDSTEDTLSYPIQEDLSDFSGSDVSPASDLVSIISALRQSLGKKITLLPSMVWRSSVPGLADDTAKGYDSEFPMYCIKSGLISSSCSSDVISMISLKPFPFVFDSQQNVVTSTIALPTILASGEASL